MILTADSCAASDCAGFVLVPLVVMGDLEAADRHGQEAGVCRALLSHSGTQPCQQADHDVVYGAQ